MKIIANFSFKKRFRVLTVATLLVVLASLVPFLSISQVAEATDFTSLRSWVNVEIPYYGENSILVKMTAVTMGNQLSHGMWIDEISSNPNTRGFSVSVVVGRAVIEAEYSSDSNTTKFIYTVSSSQYEIAPFGDFPYDFWRIGITFHTNFTAQFDPRIKHCVTPSPNYYGRYNTTYVREEQGYYYYSLNLEILHPSEFGNFVYRIFFIPIVLLGILFVTILCVTIFLLIRKKGIRQFESIYIAIGSAVIVFIPIFQLSTQELKTPFTITPFDNYFLVLLILYISLLIAVLIGKFLNVRSVVRL